MKDLLKQLDSVDVLLLLSVVVLSYIAFSGNYEYFEDSHTGKISQPHVMPSQPAPVEHKPENKPENKQEHKPEHKPEQPKKPEYHVPSPPKGGSKCGREYDNTFDDHNLMGTPLNDEMLLSSKPSSNKFQAMGYMDNSEYMGLNLCDLDKPIAGQGVQVYNSSLGSLTQMPPQNIVNSNNIFQYDMATKHLLDDSQTDSQPSDKKSGGKPDSRYHVDMIHADWCGFCKKAKPEFDKVKDDHHGQDHLGMHGYFDDFEESKDSHLIGKGKKYEVDGFPTYFLTIVVDGVEQQPIKFNAITYETIIDEIKKHVGN
jgi:thiol-disulfide isomerase/thioredoxin